MKKLDVDLLIYDLDGTLVETRQDLARAANYAIARLGRKTLPEDTLVGFIGRGVRKLMEQALEAPAEAELDSALAYFDEYYTEHLLDVSQLYTGMLTVLKHFSDKRQVVLSNKAQKYTDILIDRLNLRRYFEIVIGGQAGFKHKPAPDGILYILKQLAVAPERAVIIGDTDNDILAGKAAGIHTCAVTFGFRMAETLARDEPDVMVDSPEGLCKIISGKTAGNS